MPAAPTTDGQMLCASVYAYAIQANGSFTPNHPPYAEGSGLASPTPIVGGIMGFKLDACLVGINHALNAVVVAFRGTLPPSERSVTTALDWINDFYAEPRSVVNVPGRVHTGCWNALDALWPKLVAQVRALRKAGNAPLPLYLTGHSKGGTLAALAAVRFARHEGIQPAGVYTFAAPMPGDSEFATAYPFHSITQRYEYQDDVVPHLPPTAMLVDLLRHIPDVGKRFDSMSNWSYTPVGTLRFIDWDHKLRAASKELEVERAHHLLRQMAELQFGTLLKAHCVDCGDGYMSAINPTGVCAVSRPVDVVAIMAERGHQVSDAVKAAFEKRKPRGAA